ncbi:MAG: hypothetical protein QNJ31_03660 [Candidatus Caenarcaniphilales bacterium]|nr:hypothetical protein [Candidatus Caenarcaniphilales bacterium]
MSNSEALSTRTNRNQIGSFKSNNDFSQFNSQEALKRITSSLRNDEFSTNPEITSAISDPFGLFLEVDERLLDTNKFVESGDDDKNETLNQQEAIKLIKTFVPADTLKDTKALKRLFKKYDLNGDGELSKTEIKSPRKLIEEATVKNTKDLAELAIDLGDEDEDGGLNDKELSHFIESYYSSSGSSEQLKDEYIKKVTQNIFKELDKDGNDKLNIPEMQALFDSMIQNMDVIDGTGALKAFEPKEEEGTAVNKKDDYSSLVNIQFSQPELRANASA